MKSRRYFTYDKHCFSWSNIASLFSCLLPSIFFKNAVFSRGEISFDLRPESHCRAEDYGIALELEIVTTHLHHLSSIVFRTWVMASCLKLDLMKYIIKEICKIEIYFHFHVTAAMLEVMKQFLDWTLRSTAGLLQQTFKNCVVHIGAWILCIVRQNVCEKVSS